MCLTLITLTAQDNIPTNTFKFGGYIKMDLINTWYTNGDIGERSPLRDFHLPSQIPVGERSVNHDLDYHVKESRINFDVKTRILGKEIHGFVEMDFLLSGSGDEKVSNSFNPRLRHVYVEWDRLVIGQTWSTFMVVVVPDEIDFAGAMEGLVFVRQPQIRYKHDNWWFSLENPETTITSFRGEDVKVTDTDFFPDVVVRRNFSGTWGQFSVAGMVRTLHQSDSIKHTAVGFGLTAGARLKSGDRGDDIRAMLTAGQGLGRYLAANFISSSVQEADGKLNTIPSVNGYLAYNHFWVPTKLSSSFSASFFRALHDDTLAGDGTNQTAYSLSGNIKWDIVPVLRVGLEYMVGYRETLDGRDGYFHRVQLAAKYVFGYHNEVADEKRSY